MKGLELREKGKQEDIYFVIMSNIPNIKNGVVQEKSSNKF